MKRAITTSAVGLVAVLFFTMAASGAGLATKPPVFPPKKGGVYTGTIKSTFDLAVTLKASKSGKSAGIRWLCGVGRGSTLASNVSIDTDGKFKANGDLWKLAGRFVSATEASISINDIRCGGSKGKTKLTLE
jgi:hypothetical protein